MTAFLRTGLAAGLLGTNAVLLAVVVAPVAAVALSGCTPTVKVEVAPINIYAKLDADVRIKLDKEVQQAIQQNPNLF
jgi:hypothetical protein